MRYYSIHGLLTVATNTDIPVPSYFEIKRPVKKPDMVVLQRQLKFRRSERDMIMRTNYYFWRDETGLFIDYDTKDMKLAIRDIFGKPEIECTNNLRKFSTQESWDSLIYAIIWLNLIKRRHTIIHAGSLSYLGRDGVIIGAPADTGKTSTVLSLLATKKFGFMSDDATLVGGGNVYAYPEKVKVSPHTLTGNLQVKSWKRRLFKSRILELASERFLKMNLTDFYKVPNELVVDKCLIKKVFVLAGYGEGKQVREIDGKLAARILFISSAEMSTLVHRYLELYYYMFAVDIYKFFEEINRIAEDSFKGAQCYMIQAPKLEEYPQVIMETLERS